MTGGYKNGTITRPVITTFWVFFFWTAFLPHLFFFFFFLPPFTTSKAVHSQVSFRRACVSSHSLLFARLLSPLSTQYNSAIVRTVSNQERGRVRVTCSEKMMPTTQQKTSTRRGKKKGKVSGEQSERERSRENGDGRLRGKLHRIWRFYREASTKKGVVQHSCCLYRGSLNCLIASVFSSRLGSLKMFQITQIVQV